MRHFRVLEVLRALIALTLLAGASAPAQEIGANFNHDPEIIGIAMLRRIPVEPIRAVRNATEYTNGKKQPEISEGLAIVVCTCHPGRGDQPSVA